MSINSPESRRTAAPLAQRVQSGASAQEIAASLVAICLDINKALAPIVGTRGVAALHTRSFHIAARRYAWLAAERDGQPASSLVINALAAAIAQRDVDEALSGGDAYLLIFYDLLISLIGLLLTERLLRDVWPPISSGAPAQDISP